MCITWSGGVVRCISTMRRHHGHHTRHHTLRDPGRHSQHTYDLSMLVTVNRLAGVLAEIRLSVWWLSRNTRSSKNGMSGDSHRTGQIWSRHTLATIILPALTSTSSMLGSRSSSRKDLCSHPWML